MRVHMSHLSRRAILVVTLAACLISPAISFAASAERAQESGQIIVGNFILHGPYARILGKFAKSGGVFFALENIGKKDDRLIAIETTVAKKAMMHRTLMDNGIMKMRPIKGGVLIPAGGFHRFARGGDHIMLMGLNAHPGEGETLPLTLVFKQAGRLDVMIPVDNFRKPESAD